MKAAAVVAACALVLPLACTVDEVLGSNALADGGSDGGTSSDGGHPFDAGTPICPGTGPDCSPVCGDQVCHSGCREARDCTVSCSGTTCSFQCEISGGICTPSCEPGPCTMNCTPSGEFVDCVMSCEPPQSCAADCHGGTCTVACGHLEPATSCGAGVYSCSDSCPP